jgi:membrane-bound lytic murein transglycosylase B
VAAILQSVYEEDQKPSFVIMLEGNLSDFFSNLAYLDGLNSKVSDLLDTTKNLKLYLQGQQIKMGENVDQLQKTIALQTLQKNENAKNQQQQNQYLKLTEAQYQQQLADKKDAEQKSAKIKAQLFQVAGVTKAPTFGEAIAIAQSVSNIVPIRPAFLLAILSQESALGKNVGTCLLTNATTGEGKRVSNGAYMLKVFNKNGYHPNDLSYFLQITGSVGRDPLNSVISCDGFGSMGPAQFLPATWALFIDRLKNTLGYTADPWVIKDSFTASAMYLLDRGAGAKTTDTESTAAYRYNGSGNAARIYSRTVMSRASCIQTFIDNGTMSTSCQSLIF